MKLLEKTEEYRALESSASVTIGVFDGIHRGHRAIICECVDAARRLRVPSVVLTFDRNPRLVVCGSPPCVITPPSRKLELLEGLGADYTIVVRFDSVFASLKPDEFCEGVLAGHLGARYVCVGENFRFGAGGAGDVVTLAREGERLGFDVAVVPLVTSASRQISSTLIRELIAVGNVEEVNAALGRPYMVIGKVVAGHRRGKSLGFPTANLKLERDYCLPPDGVYAGIAHLGGEELACAVNIGSNPTFGDEHHAFEVYLLDFEGEIYGESLEVEFRARLRDEARFETSGDLVRQMAADVEKTRTLLEAE